MKKSFKVLVILLGLTTGVWGLIDPVIAGVFALSQLGIIGGASSRAEFSLMLPEILVALEFTIGGIWFGDFFFPSAPPLALVIIGVICGKFWFWLCDFVDRI